MPGLKSLWMMVVFAVCLSLLGCGGGNTADNSAASGSSTSISGASETFQFTATVVSISGTPSFGVTVGDKLNGKIVYLADAKDWNVTDVNQGWFHDMASPSRFEFQLNNLSYSSSASKYYVSIENDDSSVQPVRDNFEVISTSDQDSNLTSIYALSDFTASAFSSSTCNSLPQSLNFANFQHNAMFINYNNGGTSWSIHLSPDSLVKL
jgi:hypothetical protein